MNSNSPFTPLFLTTELQMADSCWCSAQTTPPCTRRVLTTNQEIARKVIDPYVYTGQKPIQDPDIVELINRPLKLAERAATRKRVLEKVVDLVSTFIRGIAV